MAKKQVQKNISTKTSKENSSSPFFAFIKSAENRFFVLAVLVAQLATFVFLKFRFPYPLSESDSGNYILSAATGKINGYRPFGYSGFMRFFHNFSDSIQFVSTWQYLLFALSAFLLLLGIFYYFKLNRWLFLALAIAVLFNPSLLYLSVYLMSDSLFVSITALWLLSAVWLILGGGFWLIPMNLLLMYWSIDVRYIGMFYPLFSGLAIAYRLWPRKAFSAVGFVVPFLVLLWYRAEQTNLMQQEFGVETFSAFGGWQKANNGVAVLPFVKIDASKFTDPTIQSVHQIVRSFPDSLFTFFNVEATNFMWVKGHPGKAFLFQYIQQTNTPYLKAWVYCGTLMDSYGSWLQKTYPMEYFKHFILPNAKNIFTVWEIMEGEKFAADQNTKSFFTTDKDEYIYPTHFFKPMTGIRKIGDGAIWVLLLVSIPLYFRAYKKQSFTFSQLLVIGFLWLFLFSFLAVSVYAAPINNFRYLMPIYFVQLVLIALSFQSLLQTPTQAKD